MTKFMMEPCRLCGSLHAVIDGAYLRHLRQKAGWSLREVGAIAGVSAVYLSDIERNKRNRLPRIVECYRALAPRP